MKIQFTTKEKPYIEFRFDEKGKLELTPSAHWYGGKNSGFVSSDGSYGNTCLPKNLNDHIEAFKKRKITELEKEILTIQKKLEKLKTQFSANHNFDKYI